MKKTLASIILLLIFSNMNAQSKKELFGKWKIESTNLSNNHLAFTKTKDDTNTSIMNWGHFIEFKEDGTYIESASAPCGLDDNRFNYSGKWKYDLKSSTIELFDIRVNSARPNIYHNYKVSISGTLRLLSYQPAEINLQVTKQWEKVTEKK